MDKETRKSRCFGFVDMTDKTEASEKIKRLHVEELDVKTMTLKLAEDRKKKQ